MWIVPPFLAAVVVAGSLASEPWCDSGRAWASLVPARGSKCQDDAAWGTREFTWKGSVQE